MYTYIYTYILTQSFWTGTKVIRRKHIVQPTGFGACSCLYVTFSYISPPYVIYYAFACVCDIILISLPNAAILYGRIHSQSAVTDTHMHIFNIHHKLCDVTAQITQQVQVPCVSKSELNNHAVCCLVFYQYITAEFQAWRGSYIHCRLMNLITHPWFHFHGSLA